MQSTLTLAQFEALLTQYGSEFSCWPDRETEQARRLLEINSDARETLKQHRQMHELLAAMPAPEFEGLRSRVLTQPLPEQPVSIADRLWRWLVPQQLSSAELWRPVTAACLPLVFGMLVGNYFSFGIDSGSQTSLYWEDELALLSLTEISSEQVQP